MKHLKGPYETRDESREIIDMCLNCTKKTCKGTCENFNEFGSTRLKMRIRCVETGKEYPNAVEVGKAIFRHPAAVRNHLKGETKSCGGLHFVYI